VALAVGLSLMPHAHAEENEAVEVVVLGERKAPSSDSLSRAEARVVPGAFGDPVRAIDVMPGVAPVVSGLPYVFVRGAPPGNVGTFVDGVRVPMLWHAFVGPSVLNPATIDSVTLHRGGYPARFGRYAGAIVNVDTKMPFPSYAGELSLRVVDAGLMQTVPLSTEGRSAALISGRYAYLGPVVSSLSSDSELGYWDYQLSAQYELGAEDRIGLLVLGASDEIRTSAYDNEVRFHRIDPRYEHDFSEDTRLSLALTLGTDRTSSENGSVSDDLVAPRAELLHRMSSDLTVRLGADASFDHYGLELGDDLRYRAIQTLRGLGASRNEQSLGVFVEMDLQPAPNVWVWPGVRADWFASEGASETALDPRIAARLEATEHLAFEHSLGLAHQSASFVPGIPGAAVTNINDGLQRSVQASSAVELRLPQDTLLSVTAFDAIYSNLADPLGTEHHLSLDPGQLLSRVRGNAYGLEFFFKRPLAHRVGVIASYTLSRSTRSYGRIETLSALDRTHVLSATLVYEPTRRWLVSARSTVQSGLPTRRATSFGPVFDGAERTPVFYRLDLRGERRFRLSEDVGLSVVAELLNATFSHETTERSCNATGCSEVGVGPIVVPNVGAELRY
jgi:hypothetical protein